MNNRTLIHAMLVLGLLMLATNVLMLKELKTTTAVEDPALPPANTLLDSGCNKMCNRLQESYTFAEPTFGVMMNENSCYRTCYSKSLEWEGSCKRSFTSNLAKQGCSHFGKMLRRTV